MIFAKVDVSLGQHHRVLNIPSGIRAEAVGVWTLALLWTRGNERDGFCPLSALDKVARGKVLTELERVGLIAREVDDDGAHGIRILRYEQCNELKSRIDERRASDRDRKRTLIPSGIQVDSERNPNGLRKDSSARPPARPRPRSESEPEQTKELLPRPSQDPHEGPADVSTPFVKKANGKATGHAPGSGIILSSLEEPRGHCKKHFFADGVCVHCRVQERTA